ncbi:transcription factor TGA2.3 isoform X1 [Selaginella moellendorffii]|uniref:transcription factor TGA2.3 isoform X1 n=1 Tax=Selaginella moellendorffii TaxID=88036 RepID=UPI000D1CFC4D|nr:transcription factor TGA2.3 isoform X1 [Selaginella moellendorffii]|eukprot:XP_024541054.1 transcription factor TGA2.3 isoform X1 [Selaginella moellendorffii]
MAADQRPSNSPRSSKPTSASITSVNSTEIYYSRQKAASDRNLELDSNANTNWDNPCMADTSPLTDNSTDVEPSPKAGKSAIVSTVHDTNKNADTKTLRRLAQNREAARKSRLRKKAYVQQLESSRIKLNQLEQELQRARQQGFYFGGSSSDQNGGNTNNTNAANSGQSKLLNFRKLISSEFLFVPGALAFDMDYARWMEEHQRQVSELRSGLQAHMADNELRVLVDGFMSHYDELFRLKGVAAKADVFHLVSGMWKTPAERCFMWMGGFRPSELLKILIPQLEPLTEQQLLGICNLQQSSQQAEDALSQGMEALQQSLADTLAAGSLGNSPNVANYMGQMAMAMGKLGTLENFVRQADNLRQQTLQQMHRILTTRQAARGLLAMGDYFARLRALSSLWSARPRE